MEIQIHETSKEKPSGKETQITVRTAVSCWTIKMEAMKNVRSAHVFDLKLLKELILFGAWDLLQYSFDLGSIYE